MFTWRWTSRQLRRWLSIYDIFYSNRSSNNQVAFSGALPIRPTDVGLGPILRVAEWNIERGRNRDKVEMTLSPSNQFEQLVRKSGNHKPAYLDRISRDLDLLRSADVIILNEVDLGMKRTQYFDVARDLAQALHFNYAYGVEFVELDRLYLGKKKLDQVAQKLPHDPNEVFGVDPRRYKGLLVRPKTFRGAHPASGPPWKTHSGSGRSVPGVSGQQVTVVAPHLEDYGFRFADGGLLDFAGQRNKTVGHKGRTLAQSDQRAWKGFLPTFFFQRTYFHFVGSYKLDWFFIKPATAEAENPVRVP